MATRFYFDSTTIPPVTPVVSSNWTTVTLGVQEDHNNLSDVRSIITTRINSPLTGEIRTYDTANHRVLGHALARRMLSAPINSQAIPAQTVTLTIQASEQRAANDLFVAWTIFLVDAAGVAVAGGTIVPFRIDGLELTTTVTARTDSATSSALTAGQVPLGSRICIEVGSSGTPSVAAQVTGHNTTFKFGDNGASDILIANGDTDASTNAGGWLDFGTTTITFVPPAQPTLRFTQDTIEGLYADGTTGTGTLRFTQDTVEGLIAVGGGASAELHFTQDTVEGLYDEVPIAVPRLQFTQDTIEGLWDEGDAPPPEEDQPESCPEGQVTTAHAAAGQITVTATIAGLIASSKAVQAKIGCD